MTGPSETDREIGLGDLRTAEAVADRYERASLVSDEAELLRGCLFALTSIARYLYGHPPEDAPQLPADLYGPDRPAPGGGEARR